ncbi:DEAD/DEAH box helicase [Bacillus cytotoxicus]|nr:DNA/RNA helicase [Bacillus cytotoxicus]AWC38546.1 DNA/RNA helicase [Bacillus cytotoxicus]AWC46524.1 DNA/RNA helicase [Bacillus cytotoxicus]AWC62764.1 DNA/RNA helicase [Bacillus cytotoxicus]KMT49569.1 competence protein ComF [Bacillus cytotoxicus]
MIQKGRQMLLHELSWSKEQLHDFISRGEIVLEKGIVRKNSNYICQRCGNQEKRLFASFLCKRCNQVCAYCRKCIMMGRVSECTMLVRSVCEGKQECFPHALQWKGVLSPGQNRAAKGVVEAIKQKESFFIWAVCGAGKTEMLFSGIDEALKNGKRVCIATPRKDVVLELAPRLQEVFPDIPFATLYGGSKEYEKEAMLIVTTTHQLLRYYRAFDVMIIDEIDAFPYVMDHMLHEAVRKAAKEDASYIYLTATPEEKWKQSVQNGKQKGVIISGRYHRHPLPVPKLKWCGNWRKLLRRKQIPQVLLDWLLIYLQKHYPIFLFVPHICYVEEVTAVLQRLHHKITGVHAEDPMRKEKVEAFRKGDIPLLITTTILERGVTVANLQVAVLGAEEDIFSESALVQIAGRVGRSSHNPKGEVIYFHYGKTKAMTAAKKHIQFMNKRAKREGLID